MLLFSVVSSFLENSDEGECIMHEQNYKWEKFLVGLLSSYKPGVHTLHCGGVQILLVSVCHTDFRK